MICVSLSCPTAADCLRDLQDLEFAEIRLDAMQVSPDEVREIFSSHRKLIATCRPGSLEDGGRLELLSTAIEAGAAYLDVELESSPDFRKALVEQARSRSCQVIVSHHDFEATPGRSELMELRARCFEAGADLAKIACAVSTPADAARLLGLLDFEAPVIAVGMGPLGAITRVAAPLLGSPFTYGSLEPGRETASGQLDRATLERLLREIRGV